MRFLAELAYIVAAVLFIIGLKRLSSPTTARSGNALGALGMLLAVVATVIVEEIVSPWGIVAGLVLGGGIGAALAFLVRMTAMPQMVALLNGFGGAASALVAGAEYLRLTDATHPFDIVIIAVCVLVGGLTFSGSMVAWAKLQEVLTGRPITYPLQKTTNLALLLLAVLLTIDLAYLGASNEPLLMAGLLGGGSDVVIVIAVVALMLGVLIVIPIGGADMPVVISLLNSYSGIAAAATGFVLRNNMLIIAGALVGASGLILTRIMCRAMNRSLANVLFGAFGGGDSGAAVAGPGAAAGGAVREFSAADAAIAMSYAQQVVIVPGYGMAVAQAQHGVKELAELLERKGVAVKFAVHPVAGRMPGHMNVLLAEAGVDYDKLKEMDAINPEMARTDVALVIGANDVVNPAAKNEPSSPLYGMPIINVDECRTVIVLKRSMRPGFAGVENPLFYLENTRMLFGDAKDSVASLVQEVKAA
ncbi:MAG TPA: NAD(P)(+) transhydrogenase (Re/Si-specific) subunit beta [Gemmatimonadaceae bacterium]|nr:NAD(P)(+) transhydrogenase (Re/Si-specific) subunit beta [Gemmatimonadaceae bacterium]